MTICFFGIYDPEYARNRVLMNGLRAHGVTIIECRVDPSVNTGFKKFLALKKEFRRIQQEQHIDAVLVCFPGQLVAWLARILFRGPVIVDLFLSAYDSYVFDRKQVGRWSVRALGHWVSDWLSVQVADAVVMDTNAHSDYVRRTFYATRKRFIRVWIGADEHVFKPQEESRDEMGGGEHTPIVHFHGTFIPLQGIRYILDAAALLRDENIQFVFVGNGQQYTKMVAYAKDLELANVSFVGSVPVTDVPNHIARADICLGIFGDTPKATRVIPNKVYECMAMGKAVLTGDTPATRELFDVTPPVLLVPLADAEALAEAIRSLCGDAYQRALLGASARTFFTTYLTAERVTEPLYKELLRVTAAC